MLGRFSACFCGAARDMKAPASANEESTVFWTVHVPERERTGAGRSGTNMARSGQDQVTIVSTPPTEGSGLLEQSQLALLAQAAHSSIPVLVLLDTSLQVAWSNRDLCTAGLMRPNGQVAVQGNPADHRAIACTQQNFLRELLGKLHDSEEVLVHLKLHRFWTGSARSRLAESIIHLQHSMPPGDYVTKDSQDLPRPRKPSALDTDSGVSDVLATMSVDIGIDRLATEESEPLISNQPLPCLPPAAISAAKAAVPTSGRAVQWPNIPQAQAGCGPNSQDCRFAAPIDSRPSMHTRRVTWAINQYAAGNSTDNERLNHASSRSERSSQPLHCSDRFSSRSHLSDRTSIVSHRSSQQSSAPGTPKPKRRVKRSASNVTASNTSRRRYNSLHSQSHSRFPSCSFHDASSARACSSTNPQDFELDPAFLVERSTVHARVQHMHLGPRTTTMLRSMSVSMAGSGFPLRKHSWVGTANSIASTEGATHRTSLPYSGDFSMSTPGSECASSRKLHHTLSSPDRLPHASGPWHHSLLMQYRNASENSTRGTAPFISRSRNASSILGIDRQASRRQQATSDPAVEEALEVASHEDSMVGLPNALKQEDVLVPNATGSMAYIEYTEEEQEKKQGGRDQDAGGSDSVAEIVIQSITHRPAQGPERFMLLMSCNDITERAAVDTLLSQLVEGQLGMVSQMFPYHVIQQLSKQKQGDSNDSGCQGERYKSVAKRHVDVTVLFLDIVGFTTMSKEVEPYQVMAYLNELFSIFDELIKTHGVHKVETAGDCYIVSAGVLEAGEGGFLHVLPHHDPAVSAARVLACAKDMLKFSATVPMPNGNVTRVRIGIHTGTCMSGLVGSRLPKFSIYGDCINTSSRMESTCVPGRIQVSEETHKLLQQESWEATGGVQVKGKGTMMTYLWVNTEDCKVKPQQLHGNGNHRHNNFSLLSTSHEYDVHQDRDTPTNTTPTAVRAVITPTTGHQVLIPTVQMISPVPTEPGSRTSHNQTAYVTSGNSISRPRMSLSGKSMHGDARQLSSLNSFENSNARPARASLPVLDAIATANNTKAGAASQSTLGVPDPLVSQLQALLRLSALASNSSRTDTSHRRWQSNTWHARPWETNPPNCNLRQLLHSQSMKQDRQQAPKAVSTSQLMITTLPDVLHALNEGGLSNDANTVSHTGTSKTLSSARERKKERRRSAFTPGSKGYDGEMPSWAYALAGNSNQHTSNESMVAVDEYMY